MTPPPRPWPGCWPPTAASPSLSPEGDVFDQMAGRYNQSRRPQPRRLPQGPRRGPAQGRPPRPPTRVRRAAMSDHRPHRPARSPARPGRPARVRRPGAAGPVPVQPPAPAWSAAASPAPHPSPKRWPTATRWSSRPWRPAWPRTAGDDPTVLDPRPTSWRPTAGLRARPGAAAGRRQRRPGPPGRLGGQARRRHLPPRRPPAPGQPPPRRLGPTDQRRHLRRRRPAGRLPRRARPGRVRPDGRRPPHRRRPLAAGLDQPHQPDRSSAAATPTRPPPRPLPQGHRPRAGPAPAGGARLPSPRRPRTLPRRPRPRPTRLPPVPRQPSATRHRNHRNHKNTRRTRFCGFCGFCGAWQESPMKGARLAVTESGEAARAASPTRYRLSRYPTRTAPAVPGHVHTRLRPSPAATSPPSPADALGPRTGPGHLSGCSWPRARRSAGELARHGRCRDRR